MSYLVLARKYRSQNFGQLVGQDAIASTLLSAIKLERVAHAYLFTGTRGVGKTSTARLFANALNNPDHNPELAAAIMNGRDTDVIEIDAASNNSVENARELIANAVYRPLRGRRKVYIIDEVHMLSQAAFNALLKTMEEPPDHVVFILCTTETHKVPATIQSRCQRFDFRNIPVPQIAAHLKEIVKAEKLSADDELLFAVARLGNGSMRDSLSLLDRLMAAGEKKLTLPMLERLLGLPDRQLIGELLDAVARADAAGALERTGELLAKGVSVDQLLTTMADRLRDLMVIASCGESTDLVELSDEARKDAVRQAAAFDGAGLVHLIALVESVAARCKSSSFPRALLDALIVRMSMAEKLADVTALVNGGSGVSGAAGVSPAPRPAAAARPSVPSPAKKILTAPEEPPLPVAESEPLPHVEPRPAMAAPASESLGAPCNTPSLDPAVVWARLQELAQTRASVGPLVANLRLVSLTPQRAVVGHASRDRFSATMALEQLKGLFAQVLGNPVSVLLQELKDIPSAAPVPVSAPAAPTPAPVAVAAPTAPRIDTQAALDHPLVNAAAELLGGKVIRVTARTDKP